MSKKNKDPEEHSESHSYYIDLRIKKIEKACDQIVQIAYNLKHSLKGSVDLPPDEIDALYQEIMKNK